MNAKDQIDVMAKNVADALQAFHDRLIRIEAWMMIKDAEGKGDGGEVSQSDPL